MPKRIVLFNFIFSLVFNLNSQTTITLQPDANEGKDAVLHGLSSEVDKNYGNVKQFGAIASTFSGSPAVIRTIIDFDLSSIPQGHVIENAKLTLYGLPPNAGGWTNHSTRDGSNACFLRKITSDWDEQTVTWNTAPATSEIGQVALPQSTSPTEDYEIDVTNLISDKYENPNSNFGMMMLLEIEDFYRWLNFHSSDTETDGKQPKLEITYSELFSYDSVAIFQSGADGKDAVLHGLSSEVDKNYGNTKQLGAIASTFSGTPGVVRGILDFEIGNLPANIRVERAYLSLYGLPESAGGWRAHSTESGPNNCYLRRITTPWEEGTVTWNLAPDFTTENELILPSSTSPTQNYARINVTQLVTDMVNNPSEGHGFMLQLVEEGFFRWLNFHSSDSETPGTYPKLEVYYSNVNTSTSDASINNLDFKVTPNPAEDYINLEIDKEVGGQAVINLLDVSGKNVFSLKISSQKTTIPLSHLPSGVYFLKVRVNNKVGTQKIIFQ